MRYILLVFFVFSAVSVSAADDYQKLQAELESADDTTRIRLLKELCLAFHIRNPAKSLEYGLQGIKEATQLGDDIGLAYLYNSIGITYVYQSNYEKAAANHLKALQLFEAQNDRRGEAKAIFDMAFMYKVFEDEYDTAITYYHRAYELFRELDDARLVLNSLNALGIVYTEARQFEKGEAYFLQMKEEANRRQLPAIEGNAMRQLGWHFYNQKDYLQSTAWYEKAGEFELSRGNREAYASSAIDLTVLYNKVGQPEAALIAGDSAVKIYHETDNLFKLTSAYRNKIWLLVNIRRYRDALAIAPEGLAVAQQAGQRNISRDLYRYMHQAYDSLQQHEQSLAYYKKYVATIDTLQNDSRKKKFAEARAIFDLDLKNKDIATQKAQLTIEEQRKFFLLGGLVLISLISFLYIRKQKVSLKLKEANEAIQLIKLEQLELLNEDLEKELDHKKREVMSYSLNFVQKNNLLSEIREELSSIQSKSEGNVRLTLQKIRNKTSSGNRIDKEWEQFKVGFEQIHPGFFTHMIRQYPRLTAHELRICALARLNLSSKEIAAINDMTIHSLKIARYRIRKKLGLKASQGFNEFLMAIEVVEEVT